MFFSSYVFGSIVCDVFLCFCHFPIWCPGFCVVLDCIDSCSLPSSSLCNTIDGLDKLKDKRSIMLKISDH